MRVNINDIQEIDSFYMGMEENAGYGAFDEEDIIEEINTDDDETQRD